MVVKVGGICCVIRTGALSKTGAIRATRLVSACGPPVDEPIVRTRGATVENARSLMSVEWPIGVTLLREWPTENFARAGACGTENAVRPRASEGLGPAAGLRLRRAAGLGTLLVYSCRNSGESGAPRFGAGVWM